MVSTEGSLNCDFYRKFAQFSYETNHPSPIRFNLNPNTILVTDVFVLAGISEMLLCTEFLICCKKKNNNNNKIYKTPKTRNVNFKPLKL